MIRRIRNFPKDRLLGGVAVSCAFAYCFSIPWASLLATWNNNDMYSYGYFIPIISGYMIWLRKDRIRSLSFRRSYLAGSVMFLCGLAALAAGHIGSIVLLQEIAIVVALAGMAFLFWGREVLRETWFPMGYLLFMIPMWDDLIAGLHAPFQKMSAYIGATFLRLFGIPVYHHGYFLDLPNITLEVVKACSGINYLISLVAIGIPLSYLFIRGWFKRIGFVLLSAVVALLCNGLRVGMIGIFANSGLRGPNGDIHGPYNLLRAVSISIVGYVVLYAILRFMADRKPVRSASSPEGNGTRTDPGSSGTITTVPRTLTLTAVAFVLFVSGFLLHMYDFRPFPLKEGLRGFPYKIQEWEGKDTGNPFPELKELGADEELSRVYVSPDGSKVQLYAGYFAYQKQNKEMINYRVKELLTGNELIEIDIGKGQTARIRGYSVGKAAGLKRVYYWYLIGGHVVTNRSLAKLHTIWSGVVRNRTNGAIVIVTADSGYGKASGDGTARDKRFIGMAFPVLTNMLGTGL